MLLLGHIILKKTPIYLVICLVTYNFNRWGFYVQPILRVFNTLKHIHTNTSTHFSATKIKMTLFLYVSRIERTRFSLRSKRKKSSFPGAFFIVPNLGPALYSFFSYYPFQILFFYSLNSISPAFEMFYP